MSDDPAEPLTIPPGTPRAFIWHYNRLYPGWNIAIVLLQLCASACTTLIPYAIGEITGAVSQGLWSSTDVLEACLPYLLLLAGLALGEMLFSRTMSICMIIVRPMQKRRVTGDLFAYLQQHSHRYFSERFAGSLSQRISEASVGLLEINYMAVVELMPIAVTLIGSLLLLATASVWLSLSLLAWMLIYVTASYQMARRAQVFAHAHAEARSTTSGKVVDAVTNLSSVRLFARNQYERQYLDRYLSREKQAARRSFFFMERVRWFQDAMALVLRLGLIILALYLWHIKRIDVAQFVMVASLGLLIVANAKYLSYQFLHFFESSGNIQNSVDTLIKPHEYPDRETAQDIRIERGDIELENVTFGYSATHPILQNFSLKIPAGQRVGIVGYSGSGKSTLLNLLLRLYEPQEGNIRIDGIEIRDMTYESLYRQVGLIPQEPGLFHRTLSENIGYGKEKARQDDIEIAARRAHAHDFIKHMEQGYEALVGERGVKLSGGQRQRIAIARVLIKNAPILIMDEATSSLDSETERLIQNSLDGIMGNKTVLVVAHRLSTIAHLDRILVMDKGRIIEDGSHHELLARKGAYARLWAHQANGSFGVEITATEDEVASVK